MNDAWSEADTKRIQRQLDKYISIDLVEKKRNKSAPNAKILYYVPYRRLHALATQIFGKGNWKTEIRQEEVVEEYEDPASQNAIHGVFVASLCCCTRVTIKSGVFHEDVGCGRARGHTKEQALTKARKFAKANGTKRALSQFGAGLGNCLQDKEFQSYLDRVKSSC